MIEERYLLDASALLALLGRELGGDVVASVLSAAAISAVNWAEVLQKAHAHEADMDGFREDLESLGVEVVPFGDQEAVAAAAYWHRGGSHLALADRACLATAAVHGWQALTADRAWATLDLGVEVRVIR